MNVKVDEYERNTRIKKQIALITHNSVNLISCFLVIKIFTIYFS